MIGGSVFDSVEIHGSPVGRLLHGFQSYFSYLDINFGRGRVGEELVDRLFFLMSFDCVVRQLAIEKIESVGEVVMNRVAVAAVIQAAKFGEEVFGFSVPGKIFKAPVVDRLGASQLINANHERAEILESANRFQIENDQAQNGKA